LLLKGLFQKSLFDPLSKEAKSLNTKNYRFHTLMDHS